MIKSFAFTLIYMIWTGICSIIGVFLFPFPSIVAIKWAHVWAYGIRFLLKYLVGIEYEVRGLENLPDKSVVIASKHQSAFETIVYHLIFRKAIFVLKKELLYLPFFGWNLLISGCIPIDRSSKVKSIKKLLNNVGSRAKLGRQIIIFPEGTRTKYKDKSAKYNPGVALMYEKCDLPVIPVAINSGKFWGRNSIKKVSGKVIISILPEVKKGLSKKDFMETLKKTIEDECDNLEK